MSQKCVAITRAGEPCKNWAERDQSDHCVKHRGWSDGELSPRALMEKTSMQQFGPPPEPAVAAPPAVAPLVVKAYKCPHCGELSEMR
jgi:hypothetical protein